MNKELFYQYLQHPELLGDRTVDDIEKIVEEYPYFQSVRLLYLKNLNNQGSISYDRELKKSAVWITDRSKLFYLLDKRVLLPIDDYEVNEKGQFISLDSNDLIDFSELENITEFGSVKKETEELTDKELRENDELSQLIMSGAAQSATFFNVDDKVDMDDFINTFKKKKSEEKAEEKQKEDKAERRKALIDNFIAEQPKIVPDKIDIPDYDLSSTGIKSEEPDIITDTLAKIYITQGKYEKAILAYEKLSLKYPEKNIYFAGQIQKIKELINNQ